MRVTFLTQWNNRSLWWGSNSRLTGIHRLRVRHANLDTHDHHFSIGLLVACKQGTSLIHYTPLSLSENDPTVRHFGTNMIVQTLIELIRMYIRSHIIQLRRKMVLLQLILCSFHINFNKKSSMICSLSEPFLYKFKNWFILITRKVSFVLSYANSRNEIAKQTNCIMTLVYNILYKCHFYCYITLVYV